MRNGIRRGGGVGAVCAALLLCAACGGGNGVPWYLDEPRLQADYLRAVADAARLDASEVCRDLPCITSPGEDSRLRWVGRDGCDRVLVCCMTESGYDGEWVPERVFATGASALWVVLPYELEERVGAMPRMTDSLECRMRMLQLLGLPPHSPYDRLLFFYADRAALLRPCPDPAVESCRTPHVFPCEVAASYREWFEERMAISYGGDTPYPWTRLGYTYDWHRDAERKRGLGEFLVPAGTSVIASGTVTVWRWCRGLTAADGGIGGGCDLPRPDGRGRVPVRP